MERRSAGPQQRESVDGVGGVDAAKGGAKTEQWRGTGFVTGAMEMHWRALQRVQAP